MANKQRSKLRMAIERIAIIAFLLAGVFIVWRCVFTPPAVSLGEQNHYREASYYQKLEDNKVQCRLCFRDCIIAEGQRGYCRTRENREGILYTLNYSMPAAIQIDPVEKEPLLHFYPGTFMMCFGTAGCNFRCIFCHNWHLAARTPEEVEGRHHTPEEAVQRALDRNVQTISFTYNEPTVFYEWIYEVAILAQKNGLNTVMHTNGAMNPEPFRELIKYLDAVCVDLKAFTAGFYEETSFSQLEPVLNTLRILKEEGVWFEITNLIIPTLNDDPEEIEEMCVWIRDNLGEDVPIQFIRFFPAYKLPKLPPTPIETLEMARDIAVEAGLQYVAIGNVPGHTHNSTFCPQCGEILVERTHFTVLDYNIEHGKCGSCGHEIPGVWH